MTTTTKKKVGRPRKDNISLHLKLPKELGIWLAEKVEKTPYCRTRQDFILETLKLEMNKENRNEQLDLMSQI